VCLLISTAVVDNCLMNGCECYNVMTVNACSCCLSLHGAGKVRGDILVFCLLFSGIYGCRSSTSTCNQAQCDICVERFASCAILMRVSYLIMSAVLVNFWAFLASCFYWFWWAEQLLFSPSLPSPTTGPKVPPPK